MKVLTITIETDANITKHALTCLGAQVVDPILDGLKPFWKGATRQSSKVDVVDDTK